MELDLNDLQNFSDKYINDTFAYLAQNAPCEKGMLVDVIAPNGFLHSTNRCAGVKWDDTNFRWVVDIEVMNGTSFNIVRYDANKINIRRHTGFTGRVL
jgi:hypothetical protein